MDLIMTTEIEEIIPESIGFNYDALKKELVSKLDYYNNLVVTEDSIKNAKKDKAALNKFLKALNDARISKEREYMRPFNEFKTKINELTGLIDAPVKSIDAQIKVFEEKEKQEKLNEITRFYRDNIGGLLEVLPLQKNYSCQMGEQKQRINSDYARYYELHHQS